MSMEKLEKKQKNLRMLFGAIPVVCLCIGLLTGCAFGEEKAEMAALVLDVEQDAFKVSWKDKGMEVIEQARQAAIKNLKEEYGEMRGDFRLYAEEICTDENREGVALVGENWYSPLYVGTKVNVITEYAVREAEVYDIEVEGSDGHYKSVMGVPKLSAIRIWLSGITPQDVEDWCKVEIQEEYLVNTALNEFEEAVREASLEQLPEGMEYINAYIGVIRNDLAQWNDEYDYALIYLDEDDIPELVTGYSGYFANVYTFHEGQLFCPIEEWGYGAMGNAGYDYVPYGNIIRNYNADFGGLERYTSYCKMNKNFEIENVCSLKYAYVDEEGHYSIDVEEPKYSVYKGGMWTEITEKEYGSYREKYDSGFIEGKYEYIRGEKDAIEIVLELYSMAEEAS